MVTAKKETTEDAQIRKEKKAWQHYHQTTEVNKRGGNDQRIYKIPRKKIKIAEAIFTYQ